MSTDACLALLLDAPLQSWGHASRFERRATALHPTRSGVLGIVAAALGIDKHSPDEAAQLAHLSPLRVSTYTLLRRDPRGSELPIVRLEDYHTVTGIRRASGKVDDDATVQTYRHYLLDARFGVLLEGPTTLLAKIATGLGDPRWGVWLGRKSCIPATPLVAAGPSDRATCWSGLLQRAGYSGTESEEAFARVIETTADAQGAERLDDAPIGFGQPLGERHSPRWIRVLPRDTVPTSSD